jgi:hypothetical protein
MMYDLVLKDEETIQRWWDGLDRDMAIEWLDAWETRDQQERVSLSEACLKSLPDQAVRPGAEPPFAAHPVLADFLTNRLAGSAG